MKLRCPVCPRHCALEEGEVGFCRARIAHDGKVEPFNAGKLVSIALDPIEKKPLKHFYPGQKILSVGSFGCNLRCPFCQNHQIAMAGINDLPCELATPEQLVALAKQMAALPAGNLGVAFTYNEPLIGYEFVRDCGKLLHEAGLKSVAVTNGQICAEPLAELLPYIDAMNIDLKGFTQEFYNFVGGSLACVQETITAAAPKCHVEVTTLIVPGYNDSEEDMRREAEWLATISPEIVLHISRFFPHHKMLNSAPTPVDTVMRLCEAARQYLPYVYAGNCG